MKKYENIQKGKLMSAYGGVGSIIETKGNGSLIVLPFDEWPFYNNYVSLLNQPHHIRAHANFVSTAKESLLYDTRLLKRLKDIGFDNLKGIFMPPIVDCNGYKLNDNANSNKLIKTDYFPKWFYCPQCRKFAHLNEWRMNWNQTFTTDGKFDDNEPACFNCSTKHGTRYKRKPLEQIRFVMACMNNGEVKDLPWNNLIGADIERHGQFQELHFTNAQVNPPAPVTDLKFTTSRTTDSIYGLKIKSGNNMMNLGQIQQYKFIDEHNNVYEMLLRNGTNMYFPNTVTSIYVPKIVPTQEEVEFLRNTYNDDVADNIFTPERLYRSFTRAFVRSKISMEDMQTLVDNDFDANQIANYAEEDDYRYDEFQFITGVANYQNNICNEQDFISEEIEFEDNFFETCKIKSLYCLRKIKETVTQISYTRIDNNAGEVSKKWYNPTLHDVADMSSFEKPTCSIPRNQITYLPAIESFGEGVFFEFDINGIEPRDKIDVILHTYAHIIMKELEFECGYTLTSLKERLYFLPEHDNYGFMIYSINGSDGSYGGLTSLFPDKIKHIIENAITRSQDCPNDPICSSEGGHCFACTDLPETSCERFNNMLSRTVFNHLFDNNQANEEIEVEIIEGVILE